jgi:transcriptional regulator
MYIPPEYLTTDTAEIVAFMQQYSFATMITAPDSLPMATHLPFMVRKNEGNKIVLTAHLAKANPQVQTLENHAILVIFSEPHAYISPSNYGKQLNVPTWNYVAVHASGRAKLIADEAAVLQVLEATINTYEAAYQAQWQSLPEHYKRGLMKDLVAFEIEVTSIQANKKLSQDKPLADQQRIIASLAQSPHSNERAVSDYMQQNLSS